MMRAKQCLESGCHGFLAYVIDAKKETCGVKDVLLVSKHPEVLTGILSDRLVKFKLGLVLAASPITCTPYHLAPTKMKEMMTHL